MAHDSIGTPAFWIGFIVFVLVLLAADLTFLHSNDREISMKSALRWTICWIIMALLFNLGVWHWFGSKSALEFLAGYLIEKALSVDNLFVFIVLFQYFAVPVRYQYRVLFCGIIGALILRGTFIALGVAILAEFHWVMYLLGLLLIWSAFKLMKGGEVHVDIEKNPMFKFSRRFVPSVDKYYGHRFFVFLDGRLRTTPLLLVLIAVEVTDLAFAMDSLPAVFGITTDPFIVFTSNIFAILGLRALYFLLASAMKQLRYLPNGLAVILLFVGAKMLLSQICPIPIVVSLGVILLLLAISVAASLLFPEGNKENAEAAS